MSTLIRLDREGEMTASLIAQASMEISPRDIAAVPLLADLLEPGTEVYVTAVPGQDPAARVRAAAALRRAGLLPVPHVAARDTESRAALEDLILRLVGEAATDRVLLIAGDTTAQRGPFESSLAMLQTGLLERHGIGAFGLAGHPEGLPGVSRERSLQALRDRLDYARHAGLRCWIVSQFCFEAQPIVGWLRLMRDVVPGVPIRVGLAGPAKLPMLLRFAVRCGVGASVRALKARGTSLSRLVTETGPEDIIRGLAAAIVEGQEVAIEGIHLFSFGGAVRTAEWIVAGPRYD